MWSQSLWQWSTDILYMSLIICFFSLSKGLLSNLLSMVLFACSSHIEKQISGAAETTKTVVVRNTCCSSRGPTLDPQHPHDFSKLSINFCFRGSNVPIRPTRVLYTHGACVRACMRAHTHIHTLNNLVNKQINLPMRTFSNIHIVCFWSHWLPHSHLCKLQGSTVAFT